MENNFNLSEFINILKNYKKQLFVFVTICTFLGFILCLVLPKYYASSSIVVPANPKTVDKNYVYGQQTIELNSAYGTEEDLDRTITALRLSSNFSNLVDSFKLIEHYKIKQSAKAKAYAMEELVTNSSIIKTDNGAISIKISDTDNDKAASIANALVAITNQNLILQNQTINNNYIQNLNNQLQNQSDELDSLQNINSSIVAIQKKALQNTIEQTATNLSLLKTSVNSPIAAILVLEKAYPSLVAEKPKLRFWIPASFFASVLFGILFILILQMCKKQK